MLTRLMRARAAESIAAWNRGDPDGVVEHTVEDVLWRDIALPRPLQGREALRTAMRTYMSAFPDLRVDVTSQILDGPRVAQEWTARGTHQGELMGIPPTGRASEVYGATVIVFDEDAQMIEGAMYWNPLAMLSQLGVMPGPGGDSSEPETTTP
jgi:steroid delta-isomerase-like uncharacterized protein